MQNPQEAEFEKKKDSSKRKNSKDEKIERLKADRNLMINEDKTKLLPHPRANQKCPCRSKKAYKKCCHQSDK